MSVIYCDMAQDQVTVIGHVLILKRPLVSFLSASLSLMGRDMDKYTVQ